MESGRQGSLQSRHRASLMSTKMLFELSPATFDGIEVGRIGWQGGEPGTGGLDPRADPLDLVSRQIVHDYHLARPELRAQHLFQIGEKDIAIGRGFDGHGRHPTTQADGAQHGEGPPVTGRALRNALATQPAPIAAGYFRGESRSRPGRRSGWLVAVRLWPPIGRGACAPFGYPVRRRAWFFLSRRFKRRNVFHNEPMLMVNCQS